MREARSATGALLTIAVTSLRLLLLANPAVTMPLGHVRPASRAPAFAVLMLRSVLPQTIRQGESLAANSHRSRRSGAAGRWSLRGFALRARIAQEWSVRSWGSCLAACSSLTTSTAAGRGTAGRSAGTRGSSPRHHKHRGPRLCGTNRTPVSYTAAPAAPGGALTVAAAPSAPAAAGRPWAALTIPAAASGASRGAVLLKTIAWRVWLPTCTPRTCC